MVLGTRDFSGNTQWRIFPLPEASLSVDKRAVTRISQCRCQHHGHMVAVYESKIKGNSQLATRVPESVELILRDR